MNPNLVKYGLIGVALYFAYDWWQKRSATGGDAASSTDAAAAAAKAAADAAAKAAATQNANDIAAAAAAKAIADKAAADAAAARQAAADAEVARRQGTSTDPIRQVPDDQLASAAASGVAAAITESDRRGLRYNHHQWNYFRALVKGEQQDPEMWAPGTSGNPVLVSQYLAMRAAVGLSGLGELGRAFPALMWIT